MRTVVINPKVMYYNKSSLYKDKDIQKNARVAKWRKTVKIVEYYLFNGTINTKNDSI